MAGIFINYGRDDAPGVAGRLFDYLATKFSRDGLFMDVDAMKPGMDFAKRLDHQVSQCRVLLAVIGQYWFDAKACRADSQCVTWDYARPGVISADARCFLKNKPPFQIGSPCCIAGFGQPQAK
jgi:hypothetical protein